MRVKEEKDDKTSLTFTMLPISFVPWLADAVVGFWCVLTEGINMTVISAISAFVGICTETNRNIWSNRKTLAIKITLYYYYYCYYSSGT